MRRLHPVYTFVGALLLMLLAVSCFTFAPSDPYGPLDPPPVYRTWYDWVWQHCGSQVRSAPDKPFNRIRWYVVEAKQFTVTSAGVADAIGAYTNGRLYLARPWVNDQRVVMHEELHAQLTEHVGHPPIFRTCGLMPDQEPPRVP